MAKGKKKKAGKGTGIFVFGIFMLFGLGFLGVMVLYPCWQLLNARGWVETDAVVESSRVSEQRGSKGGTTYAVKINYSYQYDNLRYTGTRYNFDSGHSSGYESKRVIVERYPKGKQIKCYVDPDKPSRAVIVRELGDMLWLRILMPGLFFCIGLGGIIFTLRRTRAKAMDVQAVAVKAIGRSGYCRLKARSGGLGSMINTFIGIPIFGGITVALCVGYYFIDEGFGPSLFFLVMAVFTGVATLAILVSFIRALMNFTQNVYELDISQPVARPGKELTLEWRLPQAAQSGKVIILLSGIERYTYQEGKHSKTIESLFYSQLLMEKEHPGEGQGTLKFTVPADTMHSVKLPNGNEYYWTLGLYAWSDGKNYIGSDFTLPVVPAQKEK